MASSTHREAALVIEREPRARLGAAGREVALRWAERELHHLALVRDDRQAAAVFGHLLDAPSHPPREQRDAHAGSHCRLAASRAHVPSKYHGRALAGTSPPG